MHCTCMHAYGPLIKHHRGTGAGEVISAVSHVFMASYIHGSHTTGKTGKTGNINTMLSWSGISREYAVIRAKAWKMWCKTGNALNLELSLPCVWLYQY